MREVLMSQGSKPIYSSHPQTKSNAKYLREIENNKKGKKLASYKDRHDNQYHK